MKIFLLDLWHDLREKRLWPVAAVLLLGLVAVPVLLAKPAEEPSQASAPPVAPEASKRSDGSEELASVKLAEEAPGSGSTLGVFDPSDPFKPPKGAIKKERASSADSGPSDQGSTPGQPSNGGTSADGGSGGKSGGQTGGDNTGGAPETTTTQYEYVVDLTFTSDARTRRIKGMRKLDMLPSEASPLLIFMGVTAKGSNAVFLVDSTLQAAGEGRCKPSNSECAFAYIGAGSRFVFRNDDGDTYEVLIDEVRKVEVDAKGSSSARSKRGKTARAAAGAASRRPAKAAQPKITRVTPMRVCVGGKLVIRGKGFSAKHKRNTVIFRAPGGRLTFAKPRRGSRIRLVVVVPAAVDRLLVTDAGAQKPRRFRLRVLAGRLSKYTPRRLSPVIVGGSTSEGDSRGDAACNDSADHD